MTFKEVMQELESYSSEQTKKTLMRHGAKEPFFGVKVQDLKKIVKKVKKDHELSLQLFDTSNSDAMYLAGLIADESKITKDQLQDWAEKAYWYYLSEYAVAAVCAESPHGFEMALKWIESDKQQIASAGWATLSGMASIRADEELDIPMFKSLLKRAESSIHDSKNRVKYTINGFVIAVGSYIESLSEEAKAIAENIGKVEVYMGNTACKVPMASTYIQKVVDRDKVGKKRKVARC